jgi:hypothetical protein
MEIIRMVAAGGMAAGIDWIRTILPAHHVLESPTTGEIV